MEQRELELAAYLGHEAASAATGTSGRRVGDFDDLLAFARGLESFDRAVQVRAALAAVERLPCSDSATRTYVQACVSAVRQWLLEPTQEQALEAFRAGQRVADYCGHAFNVYRTLGWTPCGIEGVAELLGWPDEARDEPVVSCLVECWQVLGVKVLEAVSAELIPRALA